MNRAVPFLMRAFCAGLLLVALPVPAAEVAPLPDPDREGQELAKKLRDAPPEGDSSFSGVLETLTKDDRIRRVPLKSQITVTATNWTVRYESEGTNGVPAERLVITHAAGQSNRYERSLNGTNVPVTALDVAFAQSDFWLIDLGLEFLHWPKQRRLGHEMRHSRSCHIMESANPNPSATGYARVKYWVDIEHGGILRAEAFDRSGREAKMFKVDNFEKVDGRWRLESIEIRTPRSGQETTLRFDLQKK